MDSRLPNTEISFTRIMEKIIPNIRINYDFNLVFTPYPNNYDFINDFYCRSFLHKSKFEVYKEFNENPFLNKEKKDELNIYFNKAQKIYLFFKKRYYAKTFHKYQHYSGNIDLFHNSLDSCNKRYKISLVCDDIIYKFNVNDLIRIINTGLVYSPDFFPEPKMPTNPWTNVTLTKTNLYNIYFHIVNNNILLPQLFYSFFRCDWDISKFLCNHEAFIRDVAIKHYYDDVNELTKYNDIIIMLRKYRSIISNLVIHPRFSRNEVVEKLQHLLPLHLTCEYTHNPTNRLLAKRNLKRELKKFSRNNPQFGRIILTSRRSHRTMFPNREVETHIQEGSQLPNHLFYSSLNLLSNTIPNYTRVEDLLDHITESLESSTNNENNNDDDDEDNNNEDDYDGEQITQDSEDEIEPREIPIRTRFYTFSQMQSMHEATEEAEAESQPLNVQNTPQLYIEGTRILTQNMPIENQELVDVYISEDDDDVVMTAVNDYLDENINDEDDFEDDEFDVDEIELPDDDSQPDSN